MRRVAGAGVELAVLDEGRGPPVLLIHGFPDSSRLWRHQVPALVGAGLRVVAPDPRGFGESDRPEAVEEYAIGRSMADMVALLDGLGVERARVVGHDWGAVVAWALAASAPDRVERLVALSVGHPARARRRTLADRERGWYMLLFQFAGVAEELLTRDDWALFRAFLRGQGDLEPTWPTSPAPARSPRGSTGIAPTRIRRAARRAAAPARRDDADAGHLEQRGPVPGRGAGARVGRARGRAVAL